MTDALPPPPPGHHPDNSMWVDEQVWGHRLWDSTSPWLMLLEFLGVAEAREREGMLLDDGGQPYPLSYRPAKRMYVRNILYNDELLARVAAEGMADGASWNKWLPWMADRARAVPDRDFSYLRKRFRSFADFATLVGMLRSTTIENGTNKRWSSRFVFPFGRHALYEDLNVKGDSPSREYINFGLPGELLYQMLCRSARAAELRLRLTAFFDGDPCDRLLALLEPEEEADRARRGNSFLPYAQHRCFDELAEDWLAVLGQGLSAADTYPHLATLAAFHLMRYQLVVAADLSAGGRPPFFVCEVVAPRRTPVRELSVASFQRNDGLPPRAVEAYVNAIAQTAEWRRAAAGDTPYHECRRIMHEAVRWPDGDDYVGAHDPGELLAGLRKAALARHRQHVANVHRSYGAGAGLVSRRGTTHLRYAPTDALLRTLIMANVDLRLDYAEFLALLHARYGLVIGDREAEEVLGEEEFDRKSFQNNASRLERRLRTLGMLRRLSDACAYVENPIRRSDR